MTTETRAGVPGSEVNALRTPILISVAGACAVFTGFVWLYPLLAGRSIAQMDQRLGIEQFENGQRLQAAGEYANAIQAYELALDGQFEDPKYRTFTLKALGALLWWQESAEAALPYLEEAYASPNAPLTLYEPLCDSLLQVDRLDDIPPVCDRWYGEAARQENPEQQAQALYYLGKSEQARGDHAAAMARFSQGVQLHPGGDNAYELGIAHHRAGDWDRALTYLNQYLATGSGGRARHAREIRERILAGQSSD